MSGNGKGVEAQLLSIADCEAELVRKPDSWKALKRRAEFFAEVDDVDAAISAYQELDRFYPEQGLGLRQSLRLAESDQRWEFIVDKALEVKKQGPNPRWHKQYAEALKRLGRLSNVSDCRLCLASDPGNPILTLRLADLLVEEADDVEAERVLRQYLAEFGYDRRVCLRLLEALTRYCRWDEIVQLFHAHDAMIKDNQSVALIAKALFQLGEFDQAVHIIEEQASNQPMSHALLHLANEELSSCERWVDLERLATGHDKDDRAALKFAATAIAEQGDTARAVEFLQAQHNRGSAEAQSVLVDLAERLELWDVAAKALRMLDSSDPKHWMGQVINLGRQRKWDDAATVITEASQLLGQRFNKDSALAHLASLRLDYDAAFNHWSASKKTDPLDLEVADGLFVCALRTGRWEVAEELLTHSVNRGQDSELNTFAEVTYLTSRYAFDRASQLLIGIEESSTNDSIKIRSRVQRAKLQLEMHSNEADMEILAQQLAAAPRKNRGALVARIDLLIAAGRASEALEQISRLPSSASATSNGFRLRSWAATRRGNFEEAVELSNRYIDSIVRLAVHAPTPNLEPRSAPKLLAGMSAVFMGIRNEALRIPAFLDYHRSLGVDAFVIVDNGSTDGTYEYLMTQHDVQLYWTEDDHHLAGSGMRWVNHLIEMVDVDCWCIFLDADELLTFPGSEKRSIAELTNYLDVHGYDAARGFMLDMHPLSLTEAHVYEPGQDMIAHSSFFTHSYTQRPMSLAPYTDVRGGFRHVIGGEKYRTHTKTPIIRSTSGIRFLLSSHQTSAARIADVSTVLLHFKFLGEPIARAVEEAGWTTAPYYANKLLSHNYLAKLRDQNGDVAFKSEHTVRYSGTDQLVKLGLMQDSREFSGAQAVTG